MTEKRCQNCKHWNNDTGFCSVETIPTLKEVLCDMWENGDVE